MRGVSLRLCVVLAFAAFACQIRISCILVNRGCIVPHPFMIYIYIVQCDLPLLSI